VNAPGLGGLTGREVLALRGLRFLGSPAMRKIYLTSRICASFVPFLLGGCAGWSQETKQEEAAYQVLGVLDGAQTLQGLKHPKCYAEANPPLRGHPGASEVVAWRAFVGISHAGITEFLVKREASPTALRVWEGLGIGAEGKAVVLNWQLGAKPWGARC